MGRVPCAAFQHHGRLLRNRRNSDGPRFYTRNEGSGEFLFRASGRHPNVRVALVETLFLRVSCDEAALPCVDPHLGRLDFRRVDCDEATRLSNVSCPLAVVASDVLLGSELSEKGSSIKYGRLFPTPFGRTLNHHSSDSPDMLVLHVSSKLIQPPCLWLPLVRLGESLHGLTGGIALLSLMRLAR